MTSTVFIVDDSEPLRELVGEYLDLEPDLSVCGVAASGEEALVSLDGQSCDLVLIDVSMPGMDGLTLAGRLRARAPGLRCLMYSAHAGEDHERQAREAGAAGFVTKGNPQALLTAIRQIVSGGEFFGDSLG